MRIASFNMRQGGSHTHWRQILAAAEPDLLFVQESKDPAQFGADLLEPLPLERTIWRPTSHGKWGSALFSRSPLAPIPVPGFEGWVTGGEVQVPAEPLLAFSVHLPSQGSYLQAGHNLLDALRPIVKGRPVVLGGDWNFTVCPREADDPTEHRPGELDFLERIAAEFGLKPAWRSANPMGPLPQTLRWMRDPTTPYHCDGVFLPQSEDQAVRSAIVLQGHPWDTLSDHNPLIVDWEVAGERPG